MSKRYDARLGDSEKAAIRQGTRTAILTGCLFLIIFIMYGVGFWFGSTLIADSIDEAMKNHPAPDNILNETSPWWPIIEEGCKSYLNDTIEVLETCACGLPWESIEFLNGPNCGCSYTQSQGSDLGLSVVSGCVSGGRVMMVFFSVLIGGFSAGQIGPGVKAVADAKVAAAKMLAVIERKPLIGDGDDELVVKSVKSHHDTTRDPPPEPKKRLKPDKVKGEITMENVHFRYMSTAEQEASVYANADDATVPEHTGGVVFGGCNLTIKAGETVALVGESGCGKSTIAKLVQRFYDSTQGRILLDDIDLKDINVRDLRSCIGVVSQEPLLFDTTIEYNIRYGKPDATFEDIVQAAQSANAHDFIMSFPDGYQTMVGPRGGRLSGGQKQRVAIARAVLRQAPIMVRLRILEE